MKAFRADRKTVRYSMNTDPICVFPTLEIGAAQPRSQGSLLPVPTERERTWERGWARRSFAPLQKSRRNRRVIA